MSCHSSPTHPHPDSPNPGLDSTKMVDLGGLEPWRGTATSSATEPGLHRSGRHARENQGPQELSPCGPLATRL